MPDREQEPDLEAINLSDRDSSAVSIVRRPNRWVRSVAVVAAATLALGFLGYESTQGGSSRSSKAKAKSGQPAPPPLVQEPPTGPFSFSIDAPSNDHYMECDITTSTTPDGQEVLFAKDPKNFPDAKHPASINLSQNPRVDNSLSQAVDFTPYQPDSGGPYSMDYLEVFTDGTKLELQATPDITNGDNLYHPKPIKSYTLTDHNLIEGRVGNTDYSIDRRRGEVVLSAWCDDTFIGRYNKYEESIYTFNNTTTTSVSPTLAETR
jgi:hypothetical protein